MSTWIGVLQTVTQLSNQSSYWVPGVTPGDRIPYSVLPLAEMGTAQQEIPVEFVIFLTACAVMAALAKAGQR